jgi:DNA-binding response OmpR family regulator
MNSDVLKSIFNKTADILVFSETTDDFNKINNALRTQGFTTIRLAQSAEELSRLVTDDQMNIDWLIFIDFSSSTKTLSDILSTIQDTKNRNRYFLSCFGSPSSFNKNPTLTSLGLGSWHRIQNEKDLNDEISTLFEQINIWGYSPAKLTAAYQRRDLIKAGDHSKLLTFDQKLIDHLPNEPRLLINLAESNFLNENIDAAITLLVQVKNMDSRLSGEIADIYSKIKAAQNVAPSAEVSGSNKRNQFIVIESDPSVVKQILKVFATLGIQNPEVFDNGQAAWTWLENNPEPELIITEWKLPGLGASPLIQRMRIRGLNRVPIMVCSSKVSPEEMPLFKEFSISHLLKKPTSERELALGLKWVLQQHAHPTNQTSLEKELALAIKRKDWTKAKNLKAAYMANQKVMDSRKKLLEAEFLYQEQKYSEAIDTAKAAAKMAEVDSLDFVDLMARCQHKIGDDVVASKFMEVAAKISPQNVTRICELAQINNLIGTPQNSEKFLQAALHIDRDRQDVVESVSNWSLVIDNDDKFEQIMAHVQDKLKIISHFNNRAVQLTKQHQNDQALRIYQLILKIVPSDRPEIKARIEYNLALGLVKIGKLSHAIKILSATNCKAFPTIFQKVESLKARTKEALNEIQNMQTGNTSDLTLKKADHSQSSPASMSFISEIQILEALLHLDDTPHPQDKPNSAKKSVA